VIVIAAGDLRAGDLFYGVASGKGQHKPWPEPMVLHGVDRDGARVRVDFGGGVVRTYEPGRNVFARHA
jgi:hypothetical protein